MQAPRSSRWRGLGPRLFLSHLLVAMVGLLVAGAAAGLAGPALFAAHMRDGMMSGGMMGPGGMMGGAGQGGEMPAAALAAAFGLALWQALLVAGLVAGLAALGASLLIAGRIVGPVRQLAAASRRVAAGAYDERAPVNGDDELASLAADFNAMAAALEATEARRRALIGDVAHELRTPLTVLEGTLEGVLDGVVTSDEATWARLHDEAGRLRRLVDDLQALSRAEAGQLALELQPLAAADLVATAVERLSSQFASKGLTLTVEAPPDLPPVLADRERAVQVLTNLLINALRYTPAPGRVQVTARPAGASLAVAVADTGIGIAAEHLPHLFERFYRVDRSRSRALGGSGIGLTIARAMVEAMGGAIWATSAGPGQGATFTFTLPLARPPIP